MAQGSSRQILISQVDLEQTGVALHPYATAPLYPMVSIPNCFVIYTAVKPEQICCFRGICPALLQL